MSEAWNEDVRLPHFALTLHVLWLHRVNTWYNLHQKLLPG